MINERAKGSGLETVLRRSGAIFKADVLRSTAVHPIVNWMELAAVRLVELTEL